MAQPIRVGWFKSLLLAVTPCRDKRKGYLDVVASRFEKATDVRSLLASSINLRVLLNTMLTPRQRFLLSHSSQRRVKAADLKDFGTSDDENWTSLKGPSAKSVFDGVVTLTGKPF